MRPLDDHWRADNGSDSKKNSGSCLLMKWRELRRKTSLFHLVKNSTIFVCIPWPVSP